MRKAEVARTGNHRPLVHLWTPDINPNNGGIQAFSGFMAQALEELEINYKLFSVHATATGKHARIKHYCFGKWPRRLRPLGFGFTALAQATLRPPNLVIATHLHLAPPALMSSLIRGVPFWVVAHGIEAWSVTSSMHRYVLKKTKRILAVSRYTKEQLLKQCHLENDHAVVFPNTFNQAQFHIRSKAPYLLERYQLDATTPIIFTLGRLSSSERYKGYDAVLDALRILRPQIPKIRYILGGTGDDLPRVQQLIHQLGLENHVLLTGFIPDSELCDHYNLCDVFVMPSYGEGFGIVYLEAMACGKPVIAGCRDGSVDAVMDGELGVLVDPDDVGQLARCIHAVLERTICHPILYDSVALRQRVIKEFGFESFRSRLATHLSDCVSLC